MITALYRLIFLKIMGWRIEGDLPDLKKFILVVAPHTSNWDFVLGVFTRRIKGFRSNFVAKKELFVFPFGYFFRWMGGYAVDRSKKTNFVDAVVEIIHREEEFVVAMTPEGTRSYNQNWKTGFYYIAKKANIPIVKVALDYENKRVVFAPHEYIEKDVEQTTAELKVYFSQFKGKHPEKGVKWPE